MRAIITDIRASLPTDRGEEEDLTACSDCSCESATAFPRVKYNRTLKKCQFPQVDIPESVL